MSQSKSNLGAIACESSLAASIGARVLKDGGSAADAIIATILAVGTVDGYNSGIGGGGFALVRTPSGEYESLDFRSAAPAAVDAKDFVGKDPQLTAVGGLAVAVPGELRGLEALHKKYGKLPWARLVEPAIKLARDGFPWVEDHLRIMKKNLPPGSTDLSDSWIHTHPVLSKMFTRNGEFVPVGTIIKRPEFADTLQTIAEQGVDAFYTGPIAQSMVDAANAEGGKMTLDDFKNYKVKYTKPRSIHYKGYKVTAPCAPASGAVLLLALNILSNFPDSDLGGPGSVKDTHRLIEAMKWGYAPRTMLGDPRFVEGLEEKQDAWVDPVLGRRLAEGIDEGRTFPAEHYDVEGIEGKDDHGTSHIIVGDADGLVITVTTTITLMWGSRIIVPSTGIVLNDNMEDFSVEGRSNHFGIRPQISNYISGGKRPLSSTSPFIIEDAQGRFRYSGGAAGGSRIVSCNIQHARNVLDYGMSPAAALAHERLHDQLRPTETHLEPVHSKELESALRELGHNTVRIAGATSTACGVAYDPERDVWEAAGEPRIFNSAGVVVTV